MNKKIFATALLAIAAFVSTGVSAAVTFQNSTQLSVGQGVNSIVGQGATARANDIKITLSQTGADKELPKDGEIVVRLPEGLNFSGQPSFLVARGTNGSLSLKDSGAYGDATPGEAYGVTPTVGVTLFDTNGDGGMDRAVAVAASNGGGTDSVTISMAVTADAKATVSTTAKQAVVSVNGISGKVDLVVVQAADISKGVTSFAANKLISVQETVSSDADIAITGSLTPVVYVSIPKGTKNGDKIGLTPSGNVIWGQTTTVTITTITPFNGAAGISNSPLTASTVVSSVTKGTGPTGLTQTLEVTIQNAPTGGLPNDTVVQIKIDTLAVATGTAKVGVQGLAVTGTGGAIGLKGNAVFYNVTKNGSSAALQTGAKVTSIVKGGSSYQALPTIALTELFDGDIVSPGTNTLTITAGAGLQFKPTTAGITVAGSLFNAATASVTATKVVLTLSSDTSNSKTITIAGLQAKATALGDLEVTVGGKTIDSQYGPAGDKVVVAKGIPVGTVSVTGPTKLTKVGSNKVTSGTSAKVVLAETTYGSISLAGVKPGQVGYISVKPSAGKLTSVTIAGLSTWTTAPTFTSPCEAEATNTGIFICKVTAESSSLTLPGTQTVTITAAVSGEGAVVGDTISLEIGGNVAVSGTVDVASVLETSSTKVTGGITQVKEGSTEIQKVSGFVISQGFDSSLKDGEFRLLAPQGVAFSAGLEPSSKAGGTASTTVSTFYPNDTLVMSSNALGAKGVITVTSPSVLIAPSVSGDIVFSLIDGNASGGAKTGLVAEELTLAYADKTLEALSGGNDVSLKVNYSKTQEIEGGLEGDGYTVKSSSTATVTVSVSGSTMTIKGVAEGAATITVTDALGQTDVISVSVASGATIPAAVKSAKGVGDRTGVTFGAGASKDGGATYGTEFSVDDEVTIIATVGVDATDVGEAGAIHVAGKLADGSFVYLDEDGLFAEWDTSGLPGATVVTEELKASYTVTVVNASKLPVGKHRFALAYTTGDELIYTGKALVITIAE